MDDPLIAYIDDAANDQVHQPYTAYCQGFDAREQEIPRSLNPYADGTREQDWWFEGYDSNDGASAH